jgi:hypothetical protein
MFGKIKDNACIETKMRLPVSFVTRRAESGTSAYEYLHGRRNPIMLTEDDDLMFIVDDKHPQGGLIYIFKDHSSLMFKPVYN